MNIIDEIILAIRDFFNVVFGPVRKPTKVLPGPEVVAGVDEQESKADLNQPEYEPESLEVVDEPPEPVFSGGLMPGAVSVHLFRPIRPTLIAGIPKAFHPIPPPPGWLGALIAHGSLCQNLIKKTMYYHSAIGWDRKFKNGSAGEEIHTKYRFAKRFAEFPPPGADCDQRIMTNHRLDLIDNRINEEDKYNLHWLHRKIVTKYTKHWINYRNDNKEGIEIFKPPWALYSQGQLYYRFKKGYKISRLARDFCKWARHRNDYNNMYWNRYNDFGYFEKMNGGVWLPKKNREEYLYKLSRYYLRCRWFVWAAEMARIHTGKAGEVEAPDWWIKHCLHWGIGVCRRTRVRNKKTLFFMADKKALKLESAWVLKVMRQIVVRTPPPGSVDERQVINRKPRRIFDWPVTGGKVDAPFYFHVKRSDWREGIDDKVEKRRNKSIGVKISKIFYGACMAMVGWASSGVGSTIGGFAGASAQAGIATVLDLNKKMMEKAEIEVIGEDFIGIAKNILTDPSIAADLWDEAMGWLEADAWPYANELFGGLQEDGSYAWSEKMEEEFDNLAHKAGL